MSAEQSTPQATAMTLQRLQTIVAAYGAAPAHWPTAERAAAELLIARSEDAARLVVQARHLDRALDDSTADVPVDALARLTAATAFPPARPGARQAPIRPVHKGVASGWMGVLAAAFWPRAAMFASIAALGIVVGLASEPVYSTTSDDSVYAVSGLTTVESLEDLLP
jgi:hypothetical protein